MKCLAHDLPSSSFTIKKECDVESRTASIIEQKKEIKRAINKYINRSIMVLTKIYNIRISYNFN
jgi:hypothetical protein